MRSGKCGACTVHIEGRRRAVLYHVDGHAGREADRRDRRALTKRTAPVLGDTRLPYSHAAIGSAAMANAGASVMLAAKATRDKAVVLAISGRGATFANAAPQDVVVSSTRARARSLERVADADAVILCRPGEVGARVTLTESTAVAMMTHNFFDDVEVLNVILNKRLRYIGCLGPRWRTEELLSQLPGAPESRETLSLGRLHAPVGIDIGAETSSEIASIAAEILTLLRGRTGGPLRYRDGAIHSGATAADGKNPEPTADISSRTRIAFQADSG